MPPLMPGLTRSSVSRHTPVRVGTDCRVKPGNDGVQSKGGWVYVMTNRPYGTLYVGVTADLVRRVWEHREGVVEGFTKRYGLKLLVHAEHHEAILGAI